MSSDKVPLASAGHLLDRYAAFGIDLDGVVWRGARILEGAVDGLNAVRSTGKPLALMTNNGSYLPDVIVARLSEAGFDVRKSEILTSALVARKWVSDRGLAGESAFILGPPTLVEQFDDLLGVIRPETGARARVVIVGRDVDFNYERMRIAADAIRGGAEFLALNSDPVMPVEGGGIVPGTGAVVAALEAASGRSSTVVGKPEMPMMRAAAEMLGVEPVLMLGDRLEADIAGASRMGWDGALVLTGLTKAPSGDPTPDYLLTSLGALASVPEGVRVSEEG